MVVHRGQTVRILQEFLNSKGEEGTVTGTPTISIYYWDGSSLTTLVNAASMTSLTGNLYGYSYTVANDAAFGEYVAIFSATVDGVAGKGTAGFEVDRYISEGLVRRTGTYSSGKLTSFKMEYSRDSFSTILEDVDQDFTYDGSDNVDKITGVEN